MCWALGGTVEGEQILSLAAGRRDRQMKGARATTKQRGRAHRQSGGASATAGGRNQTEKGHLSGGTGSETPEALLVS